MVKAFIFDMDGTLFQTNLILEPALAATFDILRVKGLWQGDTPIEKYRKIMGVPLPVVWETLCPMHSLEIREESNMLFHVKLIEQIRNHNGALYPYAEQTLAALVQDYPLYIASNGQVEYLQAIVETYHLERFIKGVYSIQSIASGHKSDLVKQVIEENNIQYGAVVGDRASDIQAAQDNQLLSIGVRFDFAQDKELEKAEIVIDDLTELLKIQLDEKVY
ncbi:HAD hydrolase-like protein [Lysinibacillus macroides]|uniref:MTA/SAH nucleosidase n=1 Tax=Lysinibacillus macroides TaxID=33935 RepID=A0A0M9DFE3_9BACI|nr:HAD family hydrolase [Lysinibacillus macroides]KOY80358.1 MTA/SAH nucleosidase [Lysinibacillus macroides]QPR67667.1 HAD hydrolase-like protein [Lysinibacillus macroides]